MNMATVVLQVLLGLVFLPLSFLALRQHETDWYGTFLVASGPFASSAMVLASQKLREKCFEIALQGHPATSEEYHLRLPSGWVETPFSHGLFSGKDTLMNTCMHTKQQCDTAAPTETTATAIEGLDGCGFTTEEIVSLLWLQHWYQTGGSDRVEPLRQWEFLKYLVLNGKLGR